MPTTTTSYLKINRSIDLPMMQDTLRSVKFAAQELVDDYREKNPKTQIQDAFAGGFNSPCEDIRSFEFDFRLGKDEYRNLWIVFGCHSDSDRLFKGENIIVSLGLGGSSDLIMEKLNEGLIKLDFVEGIWYVPTSSEEDVFIKYEKQSNTATVVK